MVFPLFELLARHWQLSRLPALDILLTNNHLVYPGGTEFWTLTIAKALRQLGHTITIYSPYPGQFAQKYLSALFPVVSTVPQKKFDLILINHQTCLHDVSSVGGLKIFTSHSAFLDIERCAPGADAYVAVSEQIRDIEQKRGYDCQVIFNGIDHQRFRSTRPVHHRLHTVFARVSQTSPEAAYLRTLLGPRGVKLLTCEQRTDALETYYNRADLVLAIGRELVEAMLCERNVISMDLRGLIPHYGGAGMITPQNYQALKPYWFSGRDNPIAFDQPQTFQQQLDTYDPSVGPQLRKRAIHDFDPQKKALQYLYLYVAHSRRLSRSIRETPR